MILSLIRVWRARFHFHIYIGTLRGRPLFVSVRIELKDKTDA